MKNTYAYQLIITIIILLNLIFIDSSYGDIYKDTLKVMSKDTIPTAKKDTVKYWKVGGVDAVRFSQISLSNWAAGGQSSVATDFLINLFVKYKKKKSTWDNTLDLGYGIIKQGVDAEFRKSDDKIDLASKFGLKMSKKWFYSGLINFKSQMQPGYKYPNDSTIISDFFSPAYILSSVGLDYKPNDNVTCFFSPTTTKITFVNNPLLSEKGAFGVEKGEKVRYEIGSYIKLAFIAKIVKNVELKGKVDIFSNFMDNPENLDINSEMLLSMKINKYMSTTISMTTIYDDDIIIEVDKDKDGVTDGKGPRTQFKEVFGVGLSYKF